MTLWFEDFKVDLSWTSEPKKLTDDLIRNFSKISGDKNPIHLDSPYASQTIFGRTISHGLLGLSVATGLLYDLNIIRESVLAFGGLQWDFLRPIYPEDSIQLQLSVKETKDSHKPDRGTVIFEATLINQAQKTVQKGTWTMLIYSRAQAQVKTLA